MEIVEINTWRKPLSNDANRRLTMVFQGCQFQLLPPKQVLFIKCNRAITFFNKKTVFKYTNKLEMFLVYPERSC